MSEGSPFYNEEVLLSLLQQDSEYAFTQIYSRFRPRIYKAARTFLKSSELAEEIVQDVFLKLWLRRHTATEIDKLEAFLFTMAKNLTLDALKKISRESIANEELKAGAEIGENDIERMLLETQYAELVQQAVALLPPQQRQIYFLAKEEGLTHEEIAQQLNISKLTVKSHMAKALQSIRQYLQPYMSSLFLWGCFQGFEMVYWFYRQKNT